VFVLQRDRPAVVDQIFRDSRPPGFSVALARKMLDVILSVLRAHELEAAALAFRPDLAGESFSVFRKYPGHDNVYRTDPVPPSARAGVTASRPQSVINRLTRSVIV
jgi:hypothetical protein